MPANILTGSIIWKCLFSPRLKYIYHRGQNQQQYVMTGLEKYGDKIVSTMGVLWNIGLYTSPVILLYLYRRNYFTNDGLFMLLKFSTSVCAVFIMSLYLRSWGRVNQPAYVKFLRTLENYQNSMTLDNKKELQKYDFDFDAWPVEFKASAAESLVKIEEDKIHRGVLTLPLQMLAYAAIHSFGIRLIYPGSIGLIQTLLDANLVQGRARLVEVFNGTRSKLETKDKNTIDTMFVDNRNKTSKGRILFICSEGNAGFYEIGIMATPIEAGYSALGWNHPGFAGSTGSPYPAQEKTGIAVVVEFAIKKLGFSVEDIVLYGWSIGGYTTSWAAVNHPQLRGVVLDASFDDVMPLALGMMPKAITSIVKIAIEDYVDLNNIKLLKKYPGPILFIRRSEDEVICTEEQNMSTNRGNFLVKKLLAHRYPLIFQEEQCLVFDEWLSRTGQEQASFVTKYGNDDNHSIALINSYISSYSKSYPTHLGEDLDSATRTQVALYLGKVYMKDYNSSHCTPLPVEYLGHLREESSTISLL